MIQLTGLHAHTIIIQDGDRCVAWEKGHTGAGGAEGDRKGLIILHKIVISESHADTERGTGGWGECKVTGGPHVVSTSYECVCVCAWKAQELVTLHTANSLLSFPPHPLPHHPHL